MRGSTCQIPHRYQTEQKVHLVHSRSGVAVHVNTDGTQRVCVTIAATAVLAAALKPFVTRQCASDIRKYIFGTDFSSTTKLMLSILVLATPRRQTRRSSGMFDSDRGSNGESCVCFGGFFSTFSKEV